MHITLFAPEMLTRGGVQSYTWHLLEALATEGLSTLISYADTRALLLDERLEPYRKSGLKTYVCKRSIIKFSIEALQKTPRGSFVIVAHPGQAPIAYWLKQFGLISKYVVCLHGIEAWVKLKPNLRKALYASDKIIVTTPYTAAECSALNSIPPHKFHTIPLSAGKNLATPKNDFKLQGEFKILFVARQDKNDLYKGFTLAINATAQLCKLGVPATLNFVGTGDYSECLKDFATQHCPEHKDAVVFHGRLSDTDLVDAYFNCDVFLMPSLKEGFGIVFLEAMRAFKPCIGGWQGGTPYVISEGQSGYLIPPEDLERLVTKLKALYENPTLRRQLGECGRIRFEKEFSFDKFCDNWCSLVRSL